MINIYRLLKSRFTTPINWSAHDRILVASVFAISILLFLLTLTVAVYVFLNGVSGGFDEKRAKLETLYSTTTILMLAKLFGVAYYFRASPASALVFLILFGLTMIHVGGPVRGISADSNNDFLRPVAFASLNFFHALWFEVGILIRMRQSGTAFTMQGFGLGKARKANARRRSQDANSVFIVHGHDEHRLNEVEAFVARLGLSPIILRQQPNEGKTIIEKFERDAEVGFALVLATGDDVGGKNGARLGPRARQNVILELGYFLGKLGRERVCVLTNGDVELPSDIIGFIEVKMDKSQRWKGEVVRELQQADYNISDSWFH